MRICSLRQVVLAVAIVVPFLPILAGDPTDSKPAVPTSAPEPSAAQGQEGRPEDPFPFPEGLRGNVEFWKSVFSVWSNRQVALHDQEHPGLVYDILEVPGVMGETLSKEQQRYVREARESLEARLRSLEWMVELKAPLTDDEKGLALLITTQAGTDAVRGASTRVRTQRGMRERFRRGVEISARYDTIFRRIFREAGIPEDLAYLPHVESSFEARARSSAGAVGLWQFTRGAGRRFLTVNQTIDERLDPVAAAYGAARYLKRSYELLGDWALAVTSYNHGVEGMLRAREQLGTDFDRILREFDGRLFGFASKNFYAEFLAAREIARDAVTHFPEGLKFEPPLSTDQVILETGLSPQRIAQKYGVSLADIAAVNPAWTRRAFHGGRAIPAGTRVSLPAGTLDRIAAARTSPKTPGPPATETAKQAPAQASAPSPASTLQEAIVHVVQKGETLLKIAGRHGVSLADLLVANQISERAIIRPGQHLRIPGKR